MRVVDGQENGSIGGEVHGQPVEAVERLQQPALARELDAALAAVEVEHRFRQPGGSHEATILRVAGGQSREELANHAMWVLALELAARRVENPEPSSSSLSPSDSKERGLPDARRTLDHHTGTVAGLRRVERGMHSTELAIPLEQLSHYTTVGCLRASRRRRRAVETALPQRGSAQRAVVAGLIFLLLWSTLSGSYFALISASLWYVSAP
jgi:hypothetical protein